MSFFLAYPKILTKTSIPFIFKCKQRISPKKIQTKFQKNSKKIPKILKISNSLHRTLRPKTLSGLFLTRSAKQLFFDIWKIKFFLTRAQTKCAVTVQDVIILGGKNEKRLTLKWMDFNEKVAMSGPSQGLKIQGGL